MKRSMLKCNSLFVAILMAGTFAACNNQGTEDETEAVTDGIAEPVPTPVGELDDEAGRENFNVLLEEYIEVKDALVEDDYENAKRAAGGIISLVNSIQERVLIEKGQISEQQLEELKQASRFLAEANDISTLRQYFAVLSNELYELAKADMLTDETLYWAHCPMALDDKGANWLSKEEEIQNPYMGQKMPNCGDVMETLRN